jgi:hypothetical protein
MSEVTGYLKRLFFSDGRAMDQADVLHVFREAGRVQNLEMMSQTLWKD